SEVKTHNKPIMNTITSIMNGITSKNHIPLLERPKWRNPFGRLISSFSRFGLILSAAVSLVSTSQATLIGVKDCNCTNITLQVTGYTNFPANTFVIKLNGIIIPNTFVFTNQTIVLVRPTNFPGGVYYAEVFRNNVLFSNREITVCNCDCNGCIGPAGPAGPTGATGATGPAGPQGPQGIQGDTGKTGRPGPIGLMGATGPAGTNGVNGTNGLTGATGATGQQGPQGIQGDTGKTGRPGPIGLTGATGPAGKNGVNGTNGLTGATGPTGPQGPIGFTGAAGPAGTNGVNGTNGLTGATGPAGTNGLAGPAGPTGPAGTNGVNGTNGTGGSSEFGYIYNLSSEVVPLETAVTFSSNGYGTAGITHGLGSSQIVFANQGVYKVSFSVSGTEPNQFALFLNGVLVADSVYGSGAGTQQNTGQSILVIGANDVLTLVNHTSAAAVTLAAAPPIGGTASAVNASVLIQKLN
ncbi:MAG: hypothetical protein ACR2H1_09640, partial [Limisphaerales bacterium]